MPSKPSPSSRSSSAKTGKHDILMSIKPEHMTNIANRTKNHEYRRYLLPSTVQRIWFYTTAPLSRLEYVARVSRGKTRGEVPEDGGLGNAEFNAGMKVSKYAYEILELWKLREVITLKGAIERGYLKGAPQKYCWAPIELLQSCPLDRQEEVFRRDKDEKETESDQKATRHGQTPPFPPLPLKKSGKISDYLVSSNT
ncbi:hypothetical protein BJY04DRAFT_198990 [Aspergillus karnatakaensis]|uniref:uncharacterized protein n=1 Tax=Aspergillus karnatakaensis TaxID=1810916 RepID=UPI003CCCB5FB